MRLETSLAVVGTGHAGTFFVAEMFQALGIDVRHELVGGDGVAGWNFTHLLRDEFPQHGLHKDSVVFQQVRHPLEVISSVVCMLEQTWIDMGDRAKHRGYDWNPLDDNHPVRGMKYWIAWNHFAAGIADYTYRLEAVRSALPIILNMIGLQNEPMPQVPPRLNRHKYDHIFTWAELHEANSYLCKIVREMSVLYGYKD